VLVGVEKDDVVVTASDVVVLAVDDVAPTSDVVEAVELVDDIVDEL